IAAPGDYRSCRSGTRGWAEQTWQCEEECEKCGSQGLQIKLEGSHGGPDFGLHRFLSADSGDFITSGEAIQATFSCYFTLRNWQAKLEMRGREPPCTQSA
ncbi:MAG: hypothetical protein NT167_18250, partial [Verrucomicrobia bacterium]|nr:hypothetical protein [Verrucomicrobiota bacterium]